MLSMNLTLNGTTEVVPFLLVGARTVLARRISAQHSIITNFREFVNSQIWESFIPKHTLPDYTSSLHHTKV